jgi:predicted ATPase/class 3 adenylate cyclase
MRTDLPTGTVTLLFTDIEGSTRLLHALGPTAYADALAEHRRVLRDAFAGHGGVEVDTQGDAFFVAFPIAEGAAAAARAGQAALATGPLRVRMGLHTGTPNVAGEGYVGIDVHRGARVGALANGGQILVSPATAALLDGRLLHDVGAHRLKDFDGATRLSQLGAGDFPPLRTPGSVELPIPATRFLGREQELFDAISLVYERDPRILTVLGPGGTGKTRFCLELVRLLAEDAEGGTVFCALAPLDDPALVLQTVGERLGAASPEVTAIAARVAGKRAHVFCDNLEHLLPEAARPLAELVAAAPELRLFVTSRQALRIQGEAELDLPPLADDEAVTLFCERAQAVRPDVTETAAVHKLCARLDRLPLALELAAARTKLLSPESLLERLEARLDLLQGTRDAEERHATLRTTIAWSHDLLTEDEQRLFRRLSVFRGGSTLETAEAVCDADLDTLASLLDKSLLRRRTGRLGEDRFWMLETIREFAAEQLEESGEAEEVHGRHAERMLAIALSAHLSEDDDEPFRHEVALAERDNLRAALDWGAEHDSARALELATELENLWSAHAPTEGVRRLTDLLERPVASPTRLRARALRVLAGSAHQLRDWELADASYDESLRLFTEIGDERGSALVQTRLAYRAFARDKELSKRLVEESERLAEGRFALVEAQNAALLGHLALQDGHLEDAETHARRGRALASRLEWAWWSASSLMLLAEIAFRGEDVAAAERYWHDGLTLFAADESALGMLAAIAGLARAARARGEPGRAGMLWGAVLGEGERLPGWHERQSILAGELLDESSNEFAGAVEQGRALDLWDAVAIALGEPPQTVP